MLLLHPSVARRGLVDVRVADDEEDVLWSAKGDTGDALNVLQAKLCNSLARLLLVSAVDSNGGACGDVGLTCLVIGVGRLVLNLLDGLLWLIGNLFDTWVGHDELSKGGSVKLQLVSHCELFSAFTAVIWWK